MRTRVVVLGLLLLLMACPSEPEPRLEGVHLGMSLEELRAVHPDLREASPEGPAVDPELALELEDSSETLGFERGPDGDVSHQYFAFREDRLRSFAATYDRAVDVGALMARLEAEHGPPTLARSVGGSHANVWERRGYTLSLLALGDGPVAAREMGALVVLKSEVGDSTPLFALILVLLGLGLFNLGTAFVVMNDFNRQIRRIETQSQMDAFEKVAARSMYGALIQIAVLLVPNLVWAWAWSAEHISWSSARIVILANVGLLAAALIVKQAEDRVKACPVSPELSARKDHVLQVWRSKPFPNFVPKD